MIDRELLKSDTHAYIERYVNLNIRGKMVRTPYYINNIERLWIELMREAGVDSEKIDKTSKLFAQNRVPYGWYRGKGTPEEIIRATVEISENVGLTLVNSSPQEILEFMKQFGLGIDCSGFVYLSLRHAFSQQWHGEDFDDSLDWINSERRGVNRAGAFVFGDKASEKVNADEILPLDLVMIFSHKKGRYVHIGLVVEENDGLAIAQSVLSVSPSGVNVSRLKIENKLPVFEFKPGMGTGSWEELFADGRLEFRRLNILK